MKPVYLHLVSYATEYNKNSKLHNHFVCYRNIKYICAGNTAFSGSQVCQDHPHSLENPEPIINFILKTSTLK